MLRKPSIGWRRLFALAPGPGNKTRLSAGGWGKTFLWLLRVTLILIRLGLWLARPDRSLDQSL